MGDESRQLQQGLDAALLARLDAGTITIPVLPAVACAVLALLDDPRADDVAIASAIRNDPALAGHVMRVANSPLLRAGAVIVSLQQAIARLGIRRVGEIAFAACLGPRLFTAPAYARLIDVLWLDRANGRVVAAFEVEHTTSIYSGIVRLLDLAHGAPEQAVDGLFLVAPDEREHEVRAQLARPAFRRIGERHLRYLPYGELDRNREAMARFGVGLRPIEALARGLA